MCNNLWEVDRKANCSYTNLLPLCPYLFNQLSAVQQALGGDASDIQTGAAKMLIFN